VLPESEEFSSRQTIQTSCVIGIARTLVSSVKRKAAQYSNGEHRMIQTRSAARFAANTDYFVPSNKPSMFNFQVENLDEILEQLKREGVEVDPKVESYDYGKFGWIMNPGRKPNRTFGTKQELN
jgi:hypothetical protein